MHSRPIGQPLVEALLTPARRTYTAGWIGLVCIFMGTLCLLTALFAGPGGLKYVMAAVGIAMIWLVLVCFYLQGLSKLQEARERIEDHRDFINTMQQVSLTMTDWASHLQLLVGQHADEIARLLTQFRERLTAFSTHPVFSRLPGMEKVMALANNQYVVNATALSASLGKSTEDANAILQELHTAVVTSDPVRLAQCLADMRTLNENLRALLADKPNSLASPIRSNRLQG